MNKVLSFVILAGGVALIIYGLNASDSVSSDFSRLFSGSPTNKSIWLLIAGIVASVVGAGGLISRSKSS